MAETFLSPVIEKLLELLIEEAKSLKGLKRDVESLKDELEIIQPFLRDAEAKSERGEVNDAAKVWLKQIRKQAERIEDVVDEYLYHVEQHHRQGGFVGSLRKAGRCVKSLKPRHDIALEIQDIQKSLREIKDRSIGYGLRPLEEGSSSRVTDVERRDPRLRSLFMEDDEIIGIDGASKDLIRRLTGGPPMRSVTSLVGQGGIGKTTLARKVYNDEEVQAHFDCHAWITVSQSYDMMKLLRILIRHVCGAVARMEEDCTKEELISVLRQHLQTKRYVIVFDDVWHRDFWEDMKHALPNKENGNRIIITTRNVAIATSCKENSCDVIQKLQTWSSEMAWLLFCKRAFRDYENEGHCPQKLEQLSHEIISKCQGLPLAISTIAGLLSSKEKDDIVWRKVLSDLNSEYEKTDIPKILSLSYLDLPYHLKLCLLYFGIFPEDHQIPEWYLCRLWIAEGFVKETKNKTLEEVANEYLDELIQRNLVLFEVKNGVERHCKVHDLMHDIILTRTRELCFSCSSDGTKSHIEEKSRRLSIRDTSENVLERVRDSKIWSIFLFDVDECSKSFLIELFNTFKLLKVMDFREAPLDNLPKEVGNLFHLTYLCLRGTKVKVLPKSIGKLHNLQTLDVAGTLVRALPIEVNKLRKLRHVLAGSFNGAIEFGFDTFCGVRMGEGIGKLDELQTLARVEAYPNRVGFAKELQNLRKLKALGITKVTADMGKALGASLEKMNGLEMLYLTSIQEDDVIDLTSISSPLCLRYLQLSCRLQQLPNWISELHNLQGLVLYFSRLIDEPLKFLKGLPNLAYLHLYQTYAGVELHFEEGSFKKLKNLRLLKLEGLKVMKIDRGALPLLEELELGPCPLMKEMPSDIQHLKNLKYLCFKDMPREFVIGLQQDGGADYWKIQHLPYVGFDYNKHKGWSFDHYKLGSSDLLKFLQQQAS
ncbi:hypothetical protein TIFTF001_029954 [Ficus carica]|uniref:Uncharacterized protein n=1 Tax=Ficus carica TaxID=3494 RepID=A0AA88DSJ6_FICCA|nr:hypothetical protein TIFTF001_029954 [Ficus carica]